MRCPYGNDHVAKPLPREVRTRPTFFCDDCGASFVPTPAAELERAQERKA